MSTTSWSKLAGAGDAVPSLATSDGVCVLERWSRRAVRTGKLALENITLNFRNVKDNSDFITKKMSFSSTLE